MDPERCCILLVEDDEVDRIAAQRALEKDALACELVLAGTVADALARLREGNIGLVLIDYALPDGSGLEVQQEAGNTPCIFITGMEDQSVAVEAMKRGASDFLVKDSRRQYLELLPTAVRAAFERRRDAEARERAEQALHRAHEELEVRVAKRTTELARAIEKLKKEVHERRRAEARYRDLYDNAPDMFALVDFETSTILQCNQTLATTLGYTTQELIGRSILDLYTPECADEARRSCSASPAPPGGLRDAKRRLKRKDGTALDATLNASQVRDESGDVLSQVIFRDITEHRKLEDQLHQAERMEAVGQLAGGVAHDFNNILQVISASADFAKQGLSPETPRAQEIEQIESAAEKGARLTRKLLAFSRRQVLEAVHVHLEQMIGEMIEMLRRVIGENIRLDHVPEPPLGPVRVDLTQIEQVLINLSVNSRDAMPDGGVLTIETRNARIEPEDCRTRPWARPGRYALIRVTDTGCGMDDETLRHAFEPFFTTKEKDRGTGLGLATIYGIVRQHDGLLHVESAVGAGSTFEIYLPLAEQGEPAPPDQDRGETAGGTETILVVEDDEDIRRVTKRMLEASGYTVLAAADGLEAIGVFDAHAGEIALVMIDMVLPELSGSELRDQIKARKPEVAILFSTGYAPESVNTRLPVDEDDELIRKPYRREGLLEKVRRALDAARRETAAGKRAPLAP